MTMTMILLHPPAQVYGQPMSTETVSCFLLHLATCNRHARKKNFGNTPEHIIFYTSYLGCTKERLLVLRVLVPLKKNQSVRAWSYQCIHTLAGTCLCQHTMYRRYNSSTRYVIANVRSITWCVVNGISSEVRDAHDMNITYSTTMAPHVTSRAPWEHCLRRRRGCVDV